MQTHNNKRNNNLNVLVSDLDGTLIPFPGVRQNEEDLDQIHRLRETHDFMLIFATGRSFQSVQDALEQHLLPVPDWIICDVGTSVYEKSGDSFSNLRDYHEKLDEICVGVDRREIETILEPLKGLQLQPEENQSDFKISYWCEENELHRFVDQVNEIRQQNSLPYTCLGSVDPFSKRGLVDILPAKVDKAYALEWLSELLDLTAGRILYAGDSGNDLAALVGRYASVVVGNASEQLRTEALKLLKAHNREETCYFAENFATSGVLEGMKHYKMLGLEREPVMDMGCQE